MEIAQYGSSIGRKERGAEMKKGVLLFRVFLIAMIPSHALGLDVGETAPMFEANSTQGKIRLADYGGKHNAVLALYFAAFTQV